MKQGELWFADLSPIQGSEQARRRPVLIISGNLLNEHLQVVIVAPLTTKIKRYKGNPIIAPGSETGLKQESEVLVFHLRSISKTGLVEKIGTADKSAVDLAIQTLNDILKF